MDSTASFEQLSSPWPKTSQSLIHRFSRAAQRQLSIVDQSNQPSCHKLLSPTTPTTLSSRRQSHEAQSLSETLVVSAEEQILDDSYDRYSRTFHMVLLDPNYHVFVSSRGHGSVVYKIAQRTLVVVGDPLCSSENMAVVLEDLRQFRRSRRLRLAFMGVSESFRQFAEQQGWISFRFGCDRVINPLNNEVLAKKAGKRMLSQNRQLLDSKKGGLKLGVYAPGMTGINAKLEKDLDQLYKSWCQTKQSNGSNTQAFITAYDIFSQRTKTAFIYSVDSQSSICGMAMLRQLGAETGFHIDPCIASADAPRGTTDLLMITAMQILQRADMSYLSLGVEPCANLKDDKSRLDLSHRLANAAYRQVTDMKKVYGKKAYNDKFRPDASLESNLYVVFPKAWVPIPEALAVMKVAHVRPGHIFSKN